MLALQRFVSFFVTPSASITTFTLSLHDALPIFIWQWIYDPVYGFLNYALSFVGIPPQKWLQSLFQVRPAIAAVSVWVRDRKSTRLNSSHVAISYAVFCLKKKETIEVHGPKHHPE